MPARPPPGQVLPKSKSISKLVNSLALPYLMYLARTQPDIATQAMVSRDTWREGTEVSHIQSKSLLRDKLKKGISLYDPSPGANTCLRASVFLVCHLG